MHSNLHTFDHFTACPDCDLLLPLKETPKGHSTVCPRCAKTLSRKSSDSITKALTLSLTGLLMYLPAVFLPLMTFKSFGLSESANILESIINFYRNDYYLVSLMVLLSAVIFPLVLLTCIFTISLQIRMQHYPSFLAPLFRTFLHLEEWAMVEVYLLGILITVIKMSDSSEIHYHSGIFCFSGLVLITLAISTVIDKNLFWQTIEHKRNNLQTESLTPRHKLPKTMVTAASQGLILCHVCNKISSKTIEGKGCPRCGETLHSRKISSTGRTWALIITSAIFLAPANLLPIMRVDFLGIPSRSTIMDGIIYFFNDGAYLIGLIIFTASILVPVFKIVGLFILLLTTRPCGVSLLRQKSRMYRFVAFVGRWSMLDIFVIALLTVLVDFGIFTSIHAAPAATYFCIVVASTMFAAITFDPRIMWDKCHPCGKTITDHSKMLYHKLP